MKKILIFIGLCFSLHHIAMAQSDTVTVIYDESKPETPYEIQLNDKIIVFSDDDDDIYPIQIRSKKLFEMHWAGFEIGFNGYVNDKFQYTLSPQYEFLDLKNTKSTNFNWNIFNLGLNLVQQKFGIGFGLGLQWNNYRFNDNVVLTPDSTGINGYLDASLNASKSKLNVFWMRVPLLLEFHTKQEFFISAGAVLGVCLSSHSKQVYEDGGDKKKAKAYSDFYLSPIKVDGEIRIGYKHFGVFATYSFTDMYKSGKGPVLHPYTIGLSLIY